MREPTQSTQSTARLATWGLILTVGGVVFMALQIHQDTIAWIASVAPQAQDGWGGPPDTWAGELAVVGAVVAAVGVLCLIEVVWRIAARVDQGRPAVLDDTAADLLDADD